MKKIIYFLIFSAALISVESLSQVPRTMSFQGLLVNPSTGNPVPDGTYSFLFNVYDITTGGSPLWWEIQSSVNVQGGLYSVILGSVKPFDIKFDKSYYLEVVVGGTTLSPRIELASSAYILNENIVDLSDGRLTGSKVGKGIVADSVTAGILPLARLSGITNTQLDPAAGITSGQISSLDVSKITGTINSSNLDANLADLSDGSLSGSKVGSGINATNISTGVMPGARVGSGISADSITAGLLSTDRYSALADLNTEGLLDNNADNDLVTRLQGDARFLNSGDPLNASTMTTGTLAVVNGGTGAGDAGTARTNLGLAIGADVQASNTNLDDLSDGILTGSKVGPGINTVNLAGNVSIANGGTGAADAESARINLELGALATLNSVGDAQITGVNGSKVGSGISTTNLSGNVAITNGGTGAGDAATARAGLGLAIGTDVQAWDADLSDLADGTLSGSKVGSGIDGANITLGTIAVANGGTGAADAGTARNNLGLSIGSDVQAYDANLADLADGSLTGSIVGTGINAANITTGTLSGFLVGTGIDASKITTGTIPNGRLDADVQDLAIDGILSGSKVGSGLSADSITAGTISLLRLSGITGAQIADGTITTLDISDGTIAGSDITDGTITNADISSISTGKITGLGSLAALNTAGDAQITDVSGSKVGAGISASNISAGTLSTSWYQAYSDISSEGYLDNNAAGDLLTQTQGDGRFVNVGEVISYATVSGLGSLATLSSVGDAQITGVGGSKVGTGINASNVSSGTVAVANGGTGAANAGAARTNLGLGTLATLSSVVDSYLEATIDRSGFNATGAVTSGSLTTSGNVDFGLGGSQSVSMDYNVSGYVALIRNSNNTVTGSGLYIQAGQDGGLGTFVKFTTPNLTSCGSISEGIGGTTTIYGTSSDVRLKENITPTGYSLNDLLKINVRDFSFKSDKRHNILTGFIAQELYPIFPDAVMVPQNPDEFLSVDYGKLTPLIVKSIQDQQSIIGSQAREIERLKAADTQVKAQLDEMAKRLAAIENYLNTNASGK